MLSRAPLSIALAVLTSAFIPFEKANAQAAPDCVVTTYMLNHSGASGGAVYFDVTAPGGATIHGLNTHYSQFAGSPVGIEMWTTPGTYVGNESNPAVWTLVAVDDGMAVSRFLGNPTSIQFASPAILPPGTTGVALVAVGSAHAYTVGSGTNQNYTSVGGGLILDLGSASNTPFGGSPFIPRVWNGELCNSGLTGLVVPFCDPNENNSTGVPTVMTANFGSGVGSDLHLDAYNGPAGLFGYFLLGTGVNDPGVPIPGSLGRLCLSLDGANVIGRYNANGTQFNSLGAFDSNGDLQNLSGTSGTGSGFDVPTTLPIPGSPQILVGQTVHFQLWHREPGGQSNFSNGLSVTF